MSDFCPECGEHAVVEYENGSRECLECGARWPNDAGEFERD